MNFQTMNLIRNAPGLFGFKLNSQNPKNISFSFSLFGLLIGFIIIFDLFFFQYYLDNLHTNSEIMQGLVNPYFWTGLMDAEASFSIIVVKSKKSKIG